MATDTSIDPAAALLEVTSRLVRLQKADLPRDDEAACDPDWREVVELRATPGQLALLIALVERQRSTMQELAEYLGVAPSTATALVRRLVAQGYIERSRDETDWRAVWVRPTQAGRHAVEVYQTVNLRLLRQRLARLDDKERETIQAALPALYHLIEDNHPRVGVREDTVQN
jgi:DNA-binding MarR family transcriptional regulator